MGGGRAWGEGGRLFEFDCEGGGVGVGAYSNLIAKGVGLGWALIQI